MTHSNVLKNWQQAKKQLGLEIIAPFRLEITNNTYIDFVFLLKNFGAQKGMLITTDYNKIIGYEEIIAKAGYGFSVFEEPDERENYDKCAYIEILKDWGWSGPNQKKPEWLS